MKHNMAHRGGTARGEQHHVKEEERSLFQKDDFQDPIEETMNSSPGGTAGGLADVWECSKTFQQSADRLSSWRKSRPSA